MLRKGNQARGTDAHPPEGGGAAPDPPGGDQAAGRRPAREARWAQAAQSLQDARARGCGSAAGGGACTSRARWVSLCPRRTACFCCLHYFYSPNLNCNARHQSNLNSTIFLSIVNSSLNYSLIHSFIPFHPFTETQIQMPHFIFFASRRLCPQN